MAKIKIVNKSQHTTLNGIRYTSEGSINIDVEDRQTKIFVDGTLLWESEED